jgi:hypothetical protein
LLHGHDFDEQTHPQFRRQGNGGGESQQLLCTGMSLLVSSMLANLT